MRSARVRWALAVVLAAAWIFALLPGLFGTWVYDDWWMLDNPAYDGWDDVASTFSRTSTDYFEAAPGDASSRTGASGGSYRPLTMMTLVATHAIAPVPLLHHLVGAALHALAALLLVLALRRLGPADAWTQVAAAFAGALLLLHPVTVEAYVWINGRSDVLAGAVLSALLFVLARGAAPDAPGPWRAEPLAVGALVLAGGLAKETFVPAAALAVLGFALARRGPARWRSLGGAAVAVAVLVAARAAVGASSGGTFAGSERPLADPSLWAFLPRYAAAASHEILALRSSTMDALASMSVRPLSAAEAVAAAVMLAALAALARARDVRGVLLVVAAAASIVPTVLVSRAMWLGFDRYLYLPLVLLLAAAAPHAGALLRRVTPRLRVLLGGAAATLLLAATLQSALAASAYRSERAFEHAMLEERPADPTVAVFLACPSRGPVDVEHTRARLRAMPPEPWPNAIIVPLIACATTAGDAALLERAVDAGLRQGVGDPLIHAHAMRARYLAGRLDEALELARGFDVSSPFCPEVRRQVQIWAREAAARDPALAARLEATAGALRCLEAPVP